MSAPASAWRLALIEVGGRIGVDAAVAESAGPRDTSAGIVASRAVATREDFPGSSSSMRKRRRTDTCCWRTRPIEAGPRRWMRPYARLSSQCRGKGHPAAEGPSRCPFHVRRPGLFRGLRITLLAVAGLVVGVCLAAYADRRRS